MAPMSVYIGGLGEDTQKEDLEREFSHFGNLTKVWVARNPPGFAFIDFQNDEDAKEAIKEMNGAIINRSRIRVATSRGGNKRGRERSSRGGVLCGGHGGRVRLGKRQDHSFDNGFRHRGGDSRYRGGGYDGGSVYHSRSPISQSSDIAWKSVGVFDCPELVKSYEDSSKCEISGKKRKFSGAENVSRWSFQKRKAYVEESNDTGMNINCLPEEMLVQIFSYLKLNELGRIARVCKWWYKIASYPVLWKKIKLECLKTESQNEKLLFLSENLPTCVTHLKLDFHKFFRHEYAIGVSREFEKFCIQLGKRCPSLKALVLHHKNFLISLQSVIDLCRHYLQNLEILSIRFCHFNACSFKIDSDHCKIKVLDLLLNNGYGNYNDLTLSKMPSLKKLILPGPDVNDSWFEDDTSFLDNLEVLNLQGTDIHSSTFQMLKNHALKLTELYLCGTYVQDSCFRFSNSAFPQLKTLCLRYCPDVTCEALVSLVCSCQSLQNVYVDHRMAATYAQHPFIVANKCKLQIVKNTDKCDHFIKDSYLCKPVI